MTLKSGQNSGSGLLEFDGVRIHLGGREILSPTSFAVARGEFEIGRAHV